MDAVKTSQYFSRYFWKNKLLHLPLLKAVNLKKQKNKKPPVCLIIKRESMQPPTLLITFPVSFNLIILLLTFLTWALQ